MKVIARIPLEGTSVEHCKLEVRIEVSVFFWQKFETLCSVESNERD
jgi:hypothetical protein